MNKRLWVGLDVGVHMTCACILNSAGGVVDERELPTSVELLDAFLRPWRRGNIEIIAMEAGSTSIYFARGLERLKYSVVVFESRQIASYLGMKQNKTDRNDARSIAEVARSGRGSVPEVLVKTVECQRIRSMLATRQQIVRMRVGCAAAIGAQLNLYGGKLPKSHSARQFRRNVTDEITRLRAEQKIDLRSDIDPALSLCETLNDHVERLDETIRKLAQDIEICRRFMAIPGVGSLIALSFYSAVCSHHRFDRCNDVGPYFGLVPRVRQSGTTVARLRISKLGNSMTRQHLTTAAMIMLRTTTKDSYLKRWGLEVRERRGAGRARAAVARKLSIVMMAMWKHNAGWDPFYGSQPNAEQAPQLAI